jgi:hypothetical protein
VNQSFDNFHVARVISSLHEAAKEQEMEIGCPTDVKHVAHIGWNTSTGTLAGNAPASWVSARIYPDQFSTNSGFFPLMSRRYQNIFFVEDTHVLPPSHETCLKFVKIRMYLDISKFRQISVHWTVGVLLINDVSECVFVVDELHRGIV